tara:strand:+ start:3088 stop:3555 length:468 start_codon:yes stop_codon:yes gene_type:complete
MAGLKHLIQCHCILPQYRKRNEPVFHQFVVFSKTTVDGSVIPKFSKCNNCGVIHKIIDFCKSEVASGLDESLSVITVDDVSSSFDDKICKILNSHNCDLATWEQVEDIFECESWGSVVVLSRQKIGNTTQIKTIDINDFNRFKIKTNLRIDELGD